MRNLLWTVVFALGSSACGAGLHVPTAGGGNDAAAKYDRWLAHVDELQASVEDAQHWVLDAPKELAATLGIPETATPDEIKTALLQKLQAAGVTATGSLTVEVNVEAGASGSAAAGPGGASAEGEAHAGVEVRITVAAGLELTPEAQQLVDAAKLCLERVAGIKPRLEAIVAESATVLSEGRELLASLPNDLTGLLAAKIPEYTASFNARIDFLAGLGDSTGGTISASVSIQVSVTDGLTGG